MVGKSLNVGVLIGLMLLGGSGGGSRPAVITIGKRVFCQHFGDFPPGGLLIQVSRRWRTVGVGFVLVEAHGLRRFMGACEIIDVKITRNIYFLLFSKAI